MTKTFCDRCKKEITNDIITHQFHMYEGDSCEFTAVDICDDCYKAFESFMKIEYGMPCTNPVNNHGIERMTIGSR